MTGYPTLIKYKQYREYEAARIAASDAMMALLAGAQLATHLLQLTEGSDQLLPAVFPNVAHIRRFNLRSDAARRLLDNADGHLGAMGVPYALALHEDYLKSCIFLLEQAGLVAPRTSERSRLATQHDIIATASNETFSAVPRSQIDTLRLMRNCLIHAGGRADNALVTQVAGWTTDAANQWMKVAKRSPRTLQVGDVVEFGHGEMIVALAVTKTLDRQVNVMLQKTLPRDVWSDMVAAELAEQSPSLVRSSTASRKVKGLAKQFYSPLALTEQELAASIAKLT
ncbi:hypothetical protein MARA_02550 (plasmid) [Mycolicibacterium arabiense]|uniref:Uncharacterized protein n=1 Tax=Mycolicibacterium arabiense TaxID=1286181 RepID=A0A7I7RSR5_9MYCO|nr:hypothetical protein MARA_02550 [Mycolicibacterium arabiense]